MVFFFFLKSFKIVTFARVVYSLPTYTRAQRFLSSRYCFLVQSELSLVKMRRIMAMAFVVLVAAVGGGECVDEATFLTPRPEEHLRPRKNDRDASYEIDGATWVWIPLLILTLFTILMLMSVKSERWFEGLSLRLYLMRYVSVETLYNTLKNADHHLWHEQYCIEIGHQVFTAFGIVLLIVNVFFNPNADQRYAMAVLTYLQILSLFVNLLLDLFLIKFMDRVDVVRSVNTKLRFSHCIYQVILFCSDMIGGSLHLPVDCFIWATIHYVYEAVGLALEGLNVIGMSEFAIIAIFNAQIIGTDVASTGWTCAFGMSSLALSVVSILISQVYKWRQVLTESRTPPTKHDGGEEKHHPHHSGVEMKEKHHCIISSNSSSRKKANEHQDDSAETPLLAKPKEETPVATLTAGTPSESREVTVSSDEKHNSLQVA